MIRECSACGEKFNDQSRAKTLAGGLITHCPDCSEEHEVRYIGLQAADGKQSQVAIMKFESTKDREAYLRFWQNNSGLHKGKSVRPSFINYAGS